jgi:hypothetical protein
MDNSLWKLFNTGLTDDEREAISKQKSVEAEFQKEKEEIDKVMRRPGFRLILDKIVGDMEIAKAKLLRCSEKELARLQLEIKIRKEFLDKWTPYTQ